MEIVARACAHLWKSRIFRVICMKNMVFVHKSGKKRHKAAILPQSQRGVDSFKAEKAHYLPNVCLERGSVLSICDLYAPRNGDNSPGEPRLRRGDDEIGLFWPPIRLVCAFRSLVMRCHACFLVLVQSPCGSFLRHLVQFV